MSEGKQPNLLARQGPMRGYASKLGAYFHIDNKELARKIIALAYKRHEKVIAWKKKRGWIKDHVKADLESFDFIGELMHHPLNRKALSGWKEGDTNELMLRRCFEMKALYQDEDSFYDMIELVRLKWIHEHWDRYERSAEQAYQLISFPVLYENLIAHAAAMKEPLPDITDEPDEPEINYMQLGDSVRNGMERKG